VFIETPKTRGRESDLKPTVKDPRLVRYVAGLDESSGHSALFAQITFPKEYEVVLEPALE
jgi:hypothetical protein